MGIGEHVHWHEGLFLQPHHLQAMQRRLIEQIVGSSLQTQPYAYGMIAGELAPNAIQNGQIRFERLRVVMRSGLEVDVPGNADLPALELDKAFANANGPVTVSLGVPQWYSARGNSLDVGSTKDGRRLFRISEVTQLDENTGLNPQPLLVRRINARLMLDDDDRTDMEVLPLFKVGSPAAGAIGLPRLDTSYYPPCLIASAYAPLFELLKDLTDQVQATRGKVAKEMVRDGFDVAAITLGQVRQIFRLQVLNRFAARLPSLIRAPRITPFQCYLELRELLGELMAVKPDGDFACAEYDHDNLALTFKDLADRIREFLGGEVQARFIKVELVREGNAFIASGIKPEYLDLPEYYLSVETSEDRARVAELVQNAIRFKMLPGSVVKRVAQRGVRLALDHNPPSTLPSGAGLTYFRIMRNDDVSEKWWNDIKREASVGVTWLGMDLPDVRFTLYGLLPNQVRT
jgi:type VI secretion system protein ImpJ